jgi:hypothetical protein
MAVHREWSLQSCIKWFVARAIAVEHEFACHDRGAARSALEHLHEASRGIRSGWPDTELCLNGGRTFRCELKAPGNKVQEGSQQEHILGRLAAIGHPATWVDSVMAYGEACERHSVPLRANWRTVAQVGDELYAAAVRRQEAKEAAKGHRPGGASSGWETRRENATAFIADENAPPAPANDPEPPTKGHRRRTRPTARQLARSAATQRALLP